MVARVLGALGAAALGWSLAAVGVRYAFEQGVTTFTVVGVRLGVAALAVSVFAIGTRRGISKLAWLHGSLVGVPRVAAAPILFIASLNYVSAGVEGIFITLIPVVTALMGWLFIHEPLRRVQLTGFALALGGALLIVVAGETGLGGGEGNPLIGGALALGGVVVASASGVLARHYAQQHDTASLAVPMFVTGGVVAVLVATLVGDFEPGALDVPLWLLLIGLGLGSTLLPFVATLYASKYTTAARVSLVAYVAPVISLIAGVVLLDEVISGPIVLGGLLALTGVVLAGSGWEQSVSATPLPSQAASKRFGGQASAKVGEDFLER